MTQQYLLGFDVGTGSSKGALTTLDGKVVAIAEVAHMVSLPKPGWAELDPEGVFWSDLKTICAELLPKATDGAVAAVGVSGIGPCIAPADANFTPLRSTILYRIDTRSGAETDELQARYGEDRIVERCGNPMNIQSVGGRMLWLARNEPEVWAQTKYWFMASSYLTYKLCGAYVLDHVSASYSEPLYDASAGTWAEDWCADLAPNVKMPELVWPSQVVGTVSRAAAEETGLPEGIPVVPGTIDAFADAMSVGVRSPGDTVMIYGSTMTIISVSDKFYPGKPLWVNAHLFPGSYNQVAGMATSGSLTKWLRDLCGSEFSFADLSAAAKEVPLGSNGLVVLPYFAGEGSPLLDPEARGVMLGLTLGHGRGHIYRALLEATAYSINHVLDIMRDEGVVVDHTFATGGGTKGGLWPQIVADVTGVKQILTAESVGACYGDALFAGIGAGLVSESADWTEHLGTIEPTPGAREAYQPFYRAYRELHPATVKLQHQMAALQRG